MEANEIQMLLGSIERAAPAANAYSTGPHTNPQSDDLTRIYLDVAQSDAGWRALALLARAVQDCRNKFGDLLYLRAWHDGTGIMRDTLRFEIVAGPRVSAADLAEAFESSAQSEGALNPDDRGMKGKG